MLKQCTLINALSLLAVDTLTVYTKLVPLRFQIHDYMQLQLKLPVALLSSLVQFPRSHSYHLLM